MATARFTATLRNAEYVNATVSHSVRRASVDRAVFHAQMWLVKTQRLKDYCGFTYDQWEVVSVGDDGSETVVGEGGIADATQARLSSAGTKPGTDLVSKHSKGKKLGTKGSWRTHSYNQHERRVRSSGSGKTPRKIATENMTYSQRRLLEMREIARRNNAAQ